MEYVLHWGVDALRRRGTLGVVWPIKTHRKAYDFGGGYKIIDGCRMHAEVYVSQCACAEIIFLGVQEGLTVHIINNL